MFESAAPALLTTLHLSMAVLRRYRASGRSIVSPFVLPSFVFVLAPWVWPGAIGLVAGLAAHLAWFLACELLAPTARAPATRAIAAAARAPGPAPRPPAFATATVLAVLDEASDIKTFRIARPEGFDFKAGQFLAVRLHVDGKPHVRCYSISSAPHARGYLEISVRRQGLVSGMLHAAVCAGSTLAINRPAGQFVYPEGDDRPLALIAGGIGITPLLSMARHAVAADPMRPISLLYSARNEHDVAFRHELRLLAERHAHLRVAVTLTKPTAPTRFHTGRIDEAMLRRYVASPTHTVFCLCGPGPMIDKMRALLAGLGVPADQVRHEAFEAAIAASQVNPARAEHAAEPAAVNGHGVKITFALTGRSVTAPPSQSLLETAEAEGVAIQSSCRSGVCQSCRTRIKSGTADCHSDMLDPDDRAAGFILPCVSWPTGDCELEA